MRVIVLLALAVTGCTTDLEPIRLATASPVESSTGIIIAASAEGLLLVENHPGGATAHALTNGGRPRHAAIAIFGPSSAPADTDRRVLEASAHPAGGWVVIGKETTDLDTQIVLVRIGSDGSTARSTHPAPHESYLGARHVTAVPAGDALAVFVLASDAQRFDVAASGTVTRAPIRDWSDGPGSIDAGVHGVTAWRGFDAANLAYVDIDLAGSVVPGRLALGFPESRGWVAYSGLGWTLAGVSATAVRGSDQGILAVIEPGGCGGNPFEIATLIVRRGTSVVSETSLEFPCTVAYETTMAAVPGGFVITACDQTWLATPGESTPRLLGDGGSLVTGSDGRIWLVRRELDASVSAAAVDGEIGAAWRTRLPHPRAYAPIEDVRAASTDDLTVVAWSEQHAEGSRGRLVVVSEGSPGEPMQFSPYPRVAGVGDEVWVLDAAGGYGALAFGSDGSMRNASLEPTRYHHGFVHAVTGWNDRLILAMDTAIVVYAADGSVVHEIANDVTTAALVVSDDGMLLQLGTVGTARRFDLERGTAIDGAPFAIPGRLGVSAVIDGWSCGSGCWMATTEADGDVRIEQVAGTIGVTWTDYTFDRALTRAPATAPQDLVPLDGDRALLVYALTGRADEPTGVWAETLHAVR